MASPWSCTRSSPDPDPHPACSGHRPHPNGVVGGVYGRGYRTTARGTGRSEGSGDAPRGAETQASASAAWPAVSWAASTHATRQPRASRPPSGRKWNHASLPWGPTPWSRQPQVAQVTGASRPSRTASGRRLLGSDGWSIDRDLGPGRREARLLLLSGCHPNGPLL